MTIINKFFPSQEKEERIFLLIRKHWFNYVLFIFIAVLMIAPVIAFFIYATFINPDIIASETVYIGSVLFIGVYLLLLIGLELYGIVDFYLDVYIVTDKRIVDIRQDGLFKRQISELHLRQVQDVNANVQGFFQTLLHFGDVHIQTAGERENFVFQSIPHPYSVAKEIVNLHQRHIEECENNPIGGKNQTGVIFRNEDKASRGLPSSDTMYQKTNSADLSSQAGNLNNGLSPQSIVIKADNMPLAGELHEGNEVDL